MEDPLAFAALAEEASLILKRAQECHPDIEAVLLESFHKYGSLKTLANSSSTKKPKMRAKAYAKALMAINDLQVLLEPPRGEVAP